MVTLILCLPFIGYIEGEDDSSSIVLVLYFVADNIYVILSYYIYYERFLNV